MDVLVIYDFLSYDLFEVEKEKIIKGEIEKNKILHNELIFNKDLRFTINISRKGYKFLLNGSIDSEIILNCDRCLKDFCFNIETDFNFLFIYNDSERIEYIDEHILKIKDLIFGEIFLNIPFKKLCSFNCKGLCPNCGTDLNVNKCNCVSEMDSNPFAKLKTLIN